MGSYNQAAGKEHKRMTLGKSWGHVDVDADGGGDHVDDVPWGLFVPAEALHPAAANPQSGSDPQANNIFKGINNIQAINNITTPTSL